MKKILGIVSVFAVSVSVFALAYLVNNTKNVNPNKSQAAGGVSPVTKKVLVLNFDPYISGTTPATTYYSWNNPITLQTQYIDDVKTVSYGYVNYQIVNTQTIRDFPVKTSGSKFTNTRYKKCIDDNSAGIPVEAFCGELIDYYKLIADYNVCSQVESGAIDEVWLWGGPWFGYYEYTYAGPSSVYVSLSVCNKQFPIMGFNYERGVPEMLEDLGHRSEGVLDRVYYHGLYDPFDPNNPWSVFTAHEFRNPGNAACGTMHFAANSIADYDWGNTRTVNSNCGDWLNYPNLTGTKLPVNCNTWGCSDHEYKKYWFSHLPHASGSTNGKLNNWWAYIVDFNNNIPPTPTGCQLDGSGLTWCSNHGGIAKTKPASSSLTWTQCLDWCKLNMNSTMPLCQFNGSPNECWVNYPPAGGIGACTWSESPPKGACYTPSNPTPTPTVTLGPYSCNTDCDCTCGIYQNSCAYVNMTYSSGQCTAPDFCNGLNGLGDVACVNNTCVFKTPYRNTCASSPSPKPTGYLQAECVRAGCSGEICKDASIGPNGKIYYTSDPGSDFSNCMYDVKNACYNSARCERQSHGLCGWTQTVQLKACLTVSPMPTNSPNRVFTPPLVNTSTPIPTPTSAPVLSSNLLINSSFEIDNDGNNQPDRWTNSGRFKKSTARVRSGKYSGRHFSATNKDYSIDQTIKDILPNTLYTFSGWSNIPKTSDKFTYRIQLRWKNVLGITIKTDTIKTYTSSTSEWDYTVANKTSPSTVSSVVVRMSMDSVKGPIFVDDFSLKK